MYTLIVAKRDHRRAKASIAKGFVFTLYSSVERNQSISSTVFYPPLGRAELEKTDVKTRQPIDAVTKFNCYELYVQSSFNYLLLVWPWFPNLGGIQIVLNYSIENAANEFEVLARNKKQS